MPHAFCIHRWSIVKRWNVGEFWYFVQRCRKCDKWLRRKLEVSENASKLQPELTSEEYKRIDKNSNTPSENV